jgi:hypothetical protein
VDGMITANEVIKSHQSKHRPSLDEFHEEAVVSVLINQTRL